MFCQEQLHNSSTHINVFNIIIYTIFFYLTGSTRHFTSFLVKILIAWSQISSNEYVLFHNKKSICLNKQFVYFCNMYFIFYACNVFVAPFNNSFYLTCVQCLNSPFG